MITCISFLLVSLSYSASVDSAKFEEWATEGFDRMGYPTICFDGYMIINQELRTRILLL